MSVSGAAKVWILYRYDRSDTYPDTVGVWATEEGAMKEAAEHEAKGFETIVEPYEVRS